MPQPAPLAVAHSGMRAPQVVYSEFLEMVRAGNVRKARIDESLQKVYFGVDPVSVQPQTSLPELEASTSGAARMLAKNHAMPSGCKAGCRGLHACLPSKRAGL